MAIVLYQFPLSHFCEKARWALDFKGLDYTPKNLLPGLHVKTTTKLAGKSSVPVMVHEGKIIQGSGNIITFLDEHYPATKLTPVNPQERQGAMEWERYLDQEVGVHVRRFLYHTLLQHPKLVTDLFADSGPFWGKPFLRVIFPQVRSKMRRFMDINADTAEQSRQKLERALQRLNESLNDGEFLVGRQFTRADLSAAALLAPLFMPDQYGLNWPERLPEPLQSDINAMSPQLTWAKRIYEQYR